MNQPRQTPKVLILGGGYAGLIAAARVARAARNAEITLVDQKPCFVQRIRLHEVAAGRRPATLDYAPLLAKRGVRFLQARVESLDPAARRATVREPGGARRTLDYDALILALGSTTAASVPGVAEHAVRLDDPETLRRAFPELQRLSAAGGRVVVAGGGLTGIETATELAERFPALRITLATRGPFGDDYSPAGAAHLRRRLADLGVELKENLSIAAVAAGQLETPNGAALPFDLCFWCGGFAAPPLAWEAGLPVTANGRVRTDAALQVPGHPEIFVAGDAAAPGWDGPLPIRMGCVSALPGGAQAGENVIRYLNGETPEPFSMAFQIRCISLGRQDGLVQFVTGDDRPLPKVWTGRRAVWVKELICRMTLFTVRWEVRTGLRLYRWPRPAAGLLDSAESSNGRGGKVAPRAAG